MTFSIAHTTLQKGSGDAIALYMTALDEFDETLRTLDNISEGLFTHLGASGDLPGEGQLAVFPRVPGVPFRHVVLCHAKPSRKALKKMASKLAALVAEKEWTKIALAFSAVAKEETAACRIFLSALGAAAYRFDAFKRADEALKKARRQAKKRHWIWLTDKDDKQTAEEALGWAQAEIAGTSLCRDLGNTPANICTPAYLGAQAQKLAKNHAALHVTVLKKKAIQEHKMGALLAVARGSARQPRFIILDYAPKNAVNPHPVVLVGKGVTFDAGGISLKPAAAMDLMKYDMGGAAAVFGAIHAIATAELDVRVVALVPAVENLPDGNATKPGDIVTSMSGTTIEVLNTDAEGRLILCDALTYAERYKPQAVIDVATLTGACVIALGSPRSALLGNDETLKASLFAAGEAADDRVWTLPLDEEYGEMMKSPFADLANISATREAGTITAAAFLSRFTENYPWAHLDIASVAWHSNGENKGSSGRPVGLLLEYLRRLAET